MFPHPTVSFQNFIFNLLPPSLRSCPFFRAFRVMSDTTQILPYTNAKSTPKKIHEYEKI